MADATDDQKVLAAMDAEATKVALHMSTEVELAMKELEGLMPLIRLKVDDDLFSLIDQAVQKTLMAVASFDQHMKGFAPFRKAIAERRQHSEA